MSLSGLMEEDTDFDAYEEELAEVAEGLEDGFVDTTGDGDEMLEDGELDWTGAVRKTIEKPTPRHLLYVVIVDAERKRNTGSRDGGATRIRSGRHS